MNTEVPQQSPLHREQASPNGAPVTGPIGGPLPPGDMPMKPHLPPPEMSAVRDEEPAPAVVHHLPSDDRATAAAAAAAASSESTSESKPVPTAVPTLSTTSHAPPAHETEARGLNGTGLASAVGSEASVPKDEVVASNDNAESQSTVAQTETTTAASQSTVPTSFTESAPGTQNPFNESEEKSLGAPISSSAPKEASAAVPAIDASGSNTTASKLEPVADQHFKQESVVEAQVNASASVADAAATAVPTKTEGDGDTEMKEAQISAPAPLEAGSSPAVSSSGFGHRRESTAVSVDGAQLPLAGPDATSMSAGQIKACQNAVKGLKTRTDSSPFHYPVDPVQLNIPHYFQIVTQPMDLGTVDLKLALTAAAQKGGNKHTEKTRQAPKWNLDPAKDVYYSLEDFEKDVRLIFSNCAKFNGPDHPLTVIAQTLDGVFDKQIKSISAAVASDDNGSDAGVALGGARRQSEGVAVARPKRDIHPPPPKDLPYADRPQSAAGGKRKKSRGALTAREAAYLDKVDKEQLKYCLKAIEDFHKPPLSEFAWVFFEKPGLDLEFAPAYYATIKNPISFKEIKQRLLAGEYDDADGPKDDVNLLVNNCFTFNEKGSDVYVMGEQVKKAWSAKMADLPRPPPPAIDDDDEEEDDDDAFADDDEDTEIQIQEIRSQIAALQAKLERLTGKAKTAKKTTAKKRRPSESAGSAAKKAPAAKKAKSSGASGGETKKASAKASKKSDGSSSKKRAEEDVREVTYEQKEELAAKITQLPDDRLDGALKIIAEDKPPNANEDEEIELDIDDLSPGTLYKLYRYVVRPKGKKVTTSKLSSSDGRKRGTGGVKRKNLDESEEAARIARLQAQLDQFDSAPASTPVASKPAAAAAGHTDLVASDSSSGEEDYESESDYE